VARIKYYLVLVLLALVMLTCLVALSSYGFSPVGFLAGAGALVCVAVFLSYGRTMNSERHPINR